MTISAFFSSKHHITSLQAGVAIAFAFLLFLVSNQDRDRVKTEYETLVDKIRLVQTMRSDLLVSVAAEKSSVMADTDEASNAFAEQSIQASRNVEKARGEFEALIEKGGKEARCLDDFTTCWWKLMEIDKEVLFLAVQNTNLKALRLSFGPAAIEIRHMEEAINNLMDWIAASHPNPLGIMRLASKTITNALDIYTLQAPHIAETTVAGMDSIEKNMQQLDAQIREALSRLDAMVHGTGRPLLDEARKSYQAFRIVNKKIVDLSRRNSNIRSFTESLGQKRHMTAQCLDRLNALQETVQENATFKATR